MKMLFLIYHGFSDVSGITKKIKYQINGLRSLGHKVYVCKYEIMENGSRCRMIDNEILTNFGKGILAGFKKRIFYNDILRFVIENRIEFVYSRSYHNANPFTINLFHHFKINGIKNVIEIPTFPYDKEYIGFPLKERIELQIDKIYRRKLAKETNAIITYTDDQIIFGQKTIRISNGIEFASIPLKQSLNNISKQIHFIGVAEVHYWHGFDRFIQGIGEYYKNGGKKDLYFHIVGGVAKSEMFTSQHATGFSELISRYHIEDRIIFHGQLFGKELDDMFDKCDFAIGSLARHRSGVYNIKTLKNREYAARGIAFVYSENDSDFDNKPYILKISPDETPINIPLIINFVENQCISPTEIRNSIKDLSWSNQMNTVIHTIFNNEKI